MGKQKDTLCWECKNAVCGCSWSRNYEPVEGWVARPTKIKQWYNYKVDSFVVEECPLYEKDEVNGLTYKQLCLVWNISQRTFYRWKTNGYLKEKMEREGYIYDEGSDLYQKTIS